MKNEKVTDSDTPQKEPKVLFPYKWVDEYGSSRRVNADGKYEIRISGEWEDASRAEPLARELARLLSDNEALRAKAEEEREMAERAEAAIAEFRLAAERHEDCEIPFGLVKAMNKLIGGVAQ